MQRLSVLSHFQLSVLAEKYLNKHLKINTHKENIHSTNYKQNKTHKNYFANDFRNVWKGLSCRVLR